MRGVSKTAVMSRTISRTAIYGGEGWAKIAEERYFYEKHWSLHFALP